MSAARRDGGSTTDTLLLAAFNAYRQGLCRQPQPVLPLPLRDFNALRFHGTLGWVPLAERLDLRAVFASSNEAVSAAHQGRLDTALHHCERATAQLDALRQRTRLAWLQGVSGFQPAAAYVDYRLGDWESAAGRLGCAMDASLELEEAGLPVMQMHRIQQGHNLLRMDLRRGQRADAVRLAGLLAAYLEQRLDGLPFHRGWRPRSLRAVPRSLLRLMIHQVVSETCVAIVTGKTPAREWRILIDASRLHGDPSLAVHPQVQHALRLQAARSQNDPEAYLRGLDRLFCLGIRDCHQLWYAVLADLVEFLSELETRGSQRVRDLILRDSSHWKGVPRQLRGHFAALREPIESSAVA